MVTVRPRLSSNAPIAADASPLPRDESTPPVTKINFVSFAIFSSLTVRVKDLMTHGLKREKALGAMPKGLFIYDNSQFLDRANFENVPCLSKDMNQRNDILFEIGSI
jgi:hypothetical protein